MLKILLFILGIMTMGVPDLGLDSQESIPVIEPLPVRHCQDFSVTGNGSNAEWNKAKWANLIKLDTGGRNLETKFKILYSSRGIYLLFEGEDNKITTRFDKDFQNLYEGDVFEAFFHPDKSMPLYFEYEINHLEKELVLLVSTKKGKFIGWIPWQYEKGIKIKKRVNITGGKKEAGALIKSWSAEIFFPFEILNPFNNAPPASGTVWNANFYRLDYDSGNMNRWAWSPVGRNFHELEKFGTIKFE